MVSASASDSVALVVHSAVPPPVAAQLTDENSPQLRLPPTTRVPQTKHK